MRTGSTDDTYRRIYESLNQALGTAFDTSPTSNVAIRNHAIARAIAEVWDQNRRLSFIHDPWRCAPSILVRWERICRLYPLPTDSIRSRRARLAEKLSRFGVKPTYQVVTDRLEDALPNVFVALRHITPSEATAHWPGTAEPDAFTSTVCHLLVEVEKPAGYSEGQFYEAAGKVSNIMDSSVASHLTFDWYRNSTDPAHAGAGAWATDTDAGFYLDAEHNLDNAILDE
jgi:hypothetical protein